MIFVIEGIIKSLGVVISVLLGVAWMTVAERKLMSGIQRRRGPNVVGRYGLLQAFGDGLKLILKETTRPRSASGKLYMLAPLVSFTLALGGWSVIPLNEGVVLSDVNIGILLILAVSSLGVYGVIMSGWSSNSKYALMGGVRSTAQMISYEVSIGLTIVTVIVCSGSINLTEIVWSQEETWHMVGLYPLWIVFVISIIAETNRHPFDLPEAEAELVSGYNVEYSGGGFALFFLGEYSSIILMSSVSVLLFMGGWGNGGSIRMAGKVMLIVCLFIWVRAAYPRYRYDQLMSIGWEKILPVSIGYVVLVGGFTQL